MKRYEMYQILIHMFFKRNKTVLFLFFEIVDVCFGTISHFVYWMTLFLSVECLQFVGILWSLEQPSRVPVRPGATRTSLCCLKQCYIRYTEHHVIFLFTCCLLLVPFVDSCLWNLIIHYKFSKLFLRFNNISVKCNMCNMIMWTHIIKFYSYLTLFIGNIACSRKKLLNS